VYSVAGGNLPADGRDHQLAVSLNPQGGQPRYPLRLLGVSLSYQLPGLPAPPYPSPAAGQAAGRAERRAAAARGALAIHALAVSGRAAGGFSAPFAAGSRLARWQAGADSADLANPKAHGIRPSVTAWRVSGGSAALTFQIGAGHLIQKPGQPTLPVSGQLTVTARPPGQPVPAIATHAFFAAASAHPGQTVPLPVGNATVPVRLVAKVRAFPTAGGGGPALIVDQS
jgi:hypothetical protein